MTHNDVIEHLSAYIDGDLDGQTGAAVLEHLRTCTSCQKELEATRALRTRLRTLPASMRPRADLWNAIATRVGGAAPHMPTARDLPPVHVHDRWGSAWKFAALIVTGIGAFLWNNAAGDDGWSVVYLAGDPRTDGYVVERKSTLVPGAELVTGPQGSAEVAIADIGTALVLPDSRLRLVGSSPQEHRMHLSVGSIQASVWSPPRVFVVETPSAIAYDLGCAYDLAVDSTGASRLLVTSGEVSVETSDRVSIVLAGYVCETRPGYGPGTPYLMDASPEIVSLLQRFDDGEAGLPEVRRLARVATRDDAVSLAHLLLRTSGRSFEAVYATLSAFHTPPSTVTKERLLSRDREAFEEWLNSFAYRIVPLNTNVLP